MSFVIEVEQEEDDRWIAEVMNLPGVMAYGADRDEAISRVEALAREVLADRQEFGEITWDIPNADSACRD